MKRIIICAVLLSGVIAASLYSYFKVDRVNTEIEARIDAIIEIADNATKEEVVSQAQELTEFWEKEERVLIHFIRHSYIDLISTSMARLPKLAQYGDMGEFGAELASIKRQMRHVICSEQLTLYNLL